MAEDKSKATTPRSENPPKLTPKNRRQRKSEPELWAEVGNLVQRILKLRLRTMLDGAKAHMEAGKVVRIDPAGERNSIGNRAVQVIADSLGIALTGTGNAAAT